MIDLYLGNLFKYTHEIKQFNEILSILKENEDKLGEFCVVFGSAIIAGEDVDCIVFKDNAIIVIEMKSWSGHIYGTENADWRVDDVPIKNVFSQGNRNRFALFELLNESFHYRRFDVRVWALFSRGADCSSIKISEKNKRWFHPLSLDDFLEDLMVESSPNVIKSKKLLYPLISELNLQKKDFSDWMARKPHIEFEDLKHRFPIDKGIYNEYSFKKNFTEEYVIQYPHNPSGTKSIVTLFRRNNDGKEYLSMAIRVPYKIWEQIEDYILNVEHSWEQLKVADIKIPKQKKIVQVGPLVSHQHNGIQIRIAEEGKNLQNPKYIWINMNGIEKLQEIILERRNE